MTDPVFIHPLPDKLQVGATVALTGAEAKHSQVVRLKEGEPLVITDGAGRAVRGQWTAAGPEAIEVTQLLEPVAPRPEVTIVQALPKTDRADLAVDLMVQAGVDRIIPWAARRCIARWDGKNKQAKGRARWEKAAFAATKQSRRLVLPEVTELLGDLSRLPELVPGLLPEPGNTQPGSAENTEQGDSVHPSGKVLVGVLHEDAAGSFRSFVESAGDVEHIVLIIGPEGGVAPEELETARGFGGQPVVLGPQVLRTATAGAVALGAIGALTPRWSAVG